MPPEHKYASGEEHSPPGKRGRLILRWILGLAGAQVLFAAATGAVMAVVHRNDPPATQEATKEQTIDCSPVGIEGQAIATSLLHSWRDGADTRGFWPMGLETTTLYAVRDYKFLRAYRLPDEPSTTPNEAEGNQKLSGSKAPMYGYIFRVSSSTQGGFPINKDWMIKTMAIGKNCYVMGVDEWE